MRIIETIDLSKANSYGYIKKSVTLVEEFGMYTIITCTKNIGFNGNKAVHHTQPTMDFELAQMLYRDAKKGAI